MRFDNFSFRSLHIDDSPYARSDRCSTHGSKVQERGEWP